GRHQQLCTGGDVRNDSAVTAAGMMTRKDVVDEVGGFDEQLAVAFNDVDVCLRIRQAGYRIVFTPYAQLYHLESASRGYGFDLVEKKFMENRWGRILSADPYYNPNLTRSRGDFGLRIS